MDTQRIEYAIRLLETARSCLSSRAANFSDWEFIREIDSSVQLANEEISKLHRMDISPPEKHDRISEDPIIYECVCYGDSGPCSWCRGNDDESNE